jgi:hypothetical protein
MTGGGQRAAGTLQMRGHEFQISIHSSRLSTPLSKRCATDQVRLPVYHIPQISHRTTEKKCPQLPREL